MHSSKQIGRSLPISGGVDGEIKGTPLEVIASNGTSGIHKPRGDLMILLTQRRYQKFDRFMGEFSNGLAAVGIIGAAILLLVALGKIYQKQIYAAFVWANEFIKPLWGG